MASETVQGTLKDGRAVTLVLESASILTGMRRARLLLESQQNGEQQIDLILLRFLYADVASAMSLFRIGDDQELPLPISFETFLCLSDVTGSECEKAIYRVNPHWIIKSKEELIDPKG